MNPSSWTGQKLPTLFCALTLAEIGQARKACTAASQLRRSSDKCTSDDMALEVNSMPSGGDEIKQEPSSTCKALDCVLVEDGYRTFLSVKQWNLSMQRLTDESAGVCDRETSEVGLGGAFFSAERKSY